MSNYLNYLIEANLGLCFFLLIYYLVLGRETDFSLKRIFVMTGIITSILFPLIHLKTGQQLIPSLNTIIPSYWLPEVEITGGSAPAAHTTIERYWRYAVTTYATGVFVFLSLFIFQLVRLLIMIRRTTTYRLGRFMISESSEEYPTFSFFNFIFIGQKKSISEQEKQQILRHECVHG